MAPEFSESHVLLSVNNFSLINASQIELYNKNKNLIKKLSKTPILNYILTGQNFQQLENTYLTCVLVYMFSQMEKILPEHSSLIAKYENMDAFIKEAEEKVILNWYKNKSRASAFVWNSEYYETVKQNKTSVQLFHPIKPTKLNQTAGSGNRYLIIY